MIGLTAVYCKGCPITKDWKVEVVLWEIQQIFSNHKHSIFNTLPYLKTLCGNCDVLAFHTVSQWVPYIIINKVCEICHSSVLIVLKIIPHIIICIVPISDGTLFDFVGYRSKLIEIITLEKISWNYKLDIMQMLFNSKIVSEVDFNILQNNNYYDNICNLMYVPMA